MKNIYVLPTDKPSRLILQSNNKFRLSEIKFKGQIASGVTQHIYITSDEEIKEGDWFITTDSNKIHKSDWIKFRFNNGKKIILTTDGDLIKEGVQSIDDEFLEWFVQNPSCEEVKVEGHIYKGQDETEYKIIIPKQEPKLKNICIKCGVDLYATEGGFECQKHPKECKGIYLSKETLLIHAAEQKQHLIDMMKADEELGLYEEPKQKTTPEEVAEYLGFVNGVKWQQERMYSKEEVLNLLYMLWEANPRNIKEWFEQFKK